MSKKKYSAANLRDMTDEELEAAIGELNRAILIERSQADRFGQSYSVRERKGSGQLRRLKRDRARALTIQNERRRQKNEAHA